MEPSRDDFVIAIRSAFLKKGTKQRFSLIVLLFFSIALIVLGKFNFIAINYLKIGINEIVYRTSSVASMPERYFDLSYRSIENHINFYKDYNLTKEELEKLKSEKYEVQYLEAENKRLKKVLDDIIYLSDSIVAKVIIDKQSPFLRSIIINKGSKNSIKKGMPVLSNNYLIGKVVEVNYLTSRVLLLSDLNSKIPVTLEPNSIQSILSGDGNVSGTIQYTKENVSINNKSIVYTSGSGGLLKPGIPIGKVIKNGNKYNVDFFIDFSQLRYVNIISFLEEKN